MAPKGKTVQCIIQSVDCLIALNVSTETTGKQLIDMVFTQCNIYEKHWFGLNYYDTKGNFRWLDMEKKVNFKDIKLFPETNAHFKFQVRYYPESMRFELIQYEVKAFFFKSELSRLVSDPDVEIVPEYRVLCAVAYALLVAHEHPNIKPEDIIKRKFDRLFPPRIINNFDLSKQDWLDAIYPSLELAKSQHYSESLQQALDAMEQSPMHGVSYYAIRNKNNTDLLLGIDCYGLSIYLPLDRVNPKVAFLWQEIHNVSYTGRAFHIKPRSKDDPSLSFYSKSARQNDEILCEIAGSHLNHMRRRQNDAELELEAKEAKKAQLVNVQEKERYEQQQEANVAYETQVNSIISSTEDSKDKEKKLQAEFEKTKSMMEQQIQEARIAAETEKEKKAAAEKETESLRLQARELEQKLVKEQKMQEELNMLENERMSQEKKRLEEVERLNSLLKELEVQHRKDLERIDEISKKVADTEAQKVAAAEALAAGQATAAGVEEQTKEANAEGTAATYEQIKKQKSAELKAHLTRVGTLMKQKNKDASEQTSQVLRYAESGRDKFETLKLIRKNNTKARIDEFESY